MSERGVAEPPGCERARWAPPRAKARMRARRAGRGKIPTHGGEGRRLLYEANERAMPVATPSRTGLEGGASARRGAVAFSRKRAMIRGSQGPEAGGLSDTDARHAVELLSKHEGTVAGRLQDQQQGRRVELEGAVYPAQRLLHSKRHGKGWAAAAAQEPAFKTRAAAHLAVEWRAFQRRTDGRRTFRKSGYARRGDEKTRPPPARVRLLACALRSHASIPVGPSAQDSFR